MKKITIENAKYIANKYFQELINILTLQGYKAEVVKENNKKNTESNEMFYLRFTKHNSDSKYYRIL
jgi:hypothetical protein